MENIENFHESAHESEHGEPRYEPGDYRIKVGVEGAREDIYRSFPEFNGAPVEPLSEGLGSAVFLVGNAHVFRFPKHEKAEKGLQTEMVMLPEIREAVSVAVPNFEYLGRRQENNLQFVGYRKIEGESLTGEALKKLNGGARKGLAKDLARFFGELHVFDPAAARARGIIQERNYREHFKNQLEDVREILSPALEKVYPGDAGAVRYYLEQLFKGYLDDERNFSYAPRLLHGDLEAEHVLFDPDRNHLTGIIDWGGLHIGDPAYDLWRPYSHYGREFAEELLTHYLHEEDSAQLLKKLDFFFRAQMAHRAVRPLMLGDERRGAWALDRLHKQALRLGYWYPELKGYWYPELKEK